LEKSLPYQNAIPNAEEFAIQRENWRDAMGRDRDLRSKAIELITLSGVHNYGYQFEWCGVPIIRHPDDMVLQQEIVWGIKPSHIIETGIARGGSLVLSASLMSMSGTMPKVLGLDIQILPHTHEALKNWVSKDYIQLLECDSTSVSAINEVKNFLLDTDSPALLVLDSNHTHDHVLNELQNLAVLLPPKSVVIVADTIVEEMPEGSYPNRPWARGNNPFTAVHEFISKFPEFEIDTRWSRRSLMGECRDGILVKK
jgi:cephalosporin hydroxylase